MVPIVYSPAYDITAFGLERLHPFDGRKYGRIRDWLVRQGLRKASDFINPGPVTTTDLLRVHTPDYLRSLRDRRVLARILEVRLLASMPAWVTNWRVVRPMRRAAGGTVLACRLALERGLAVNLGGGYHHAGADRQSGFCVYADTALALSVLHAEGRIRSALVVDTDAHQGNGTADVIRNWDWAHILDFYEDDLFPWPKVREDLAVPLPPGTRGREYLDALAEHLPRALDAYRPEVVVYNARSDVLASDPLTHLALTPDDMAERDLYVVTEVRRPGIAVAMVLSGGYGPLSWVAHARSIEGLLARFGSETEANRR
jgi:histone deacetylase 11